MNKHLFYIHGYLSEPNSTKGTLFHQTLQVTPIKYRSGKPEELLIKDCLANISTLIQGKQNVILIGSSLGGYLAAATALEHTNIARLILLNPAIIPPTYDISTITDMPQRILKDMITPALFEKKLHPSIMILRGTEDTVVPEEWITVFAKAQEATVQYIHDDHAFTQTMPRLPQIISEIIQ